MPAYAEVPLEGSRYEPIGDYAAIGNCRSIALVSRSGSVDWLCLPHFSSPSVFAALLDWQHGGRFVMRPRDIIDVSREYVGHSAVLRTIYRCRGGVLQLTDAMTVVGDDGAGRELLPQHELVRLAECLEGEIELDALFDPRPDYGRHVPQLRRHGRLGWACTFRGLAVYVHGDVELASCRRGPGVEGTSTLKAGQSRRLALSYSDGEIPAIAPIADADLRVELTRRWWEDWSARCTYRGVYRSCVMRSSLTLKLLTYCLSGAVMAAATTSLPEADSGERNWDYRYCWLRDTSLLLQAFIDLGHYDESAAFLGWLLHATRLTQPHSQVLYDVYGETALDERQLRHLEGYRGIGPVRVGNAAVDQVQFDLYGEVILTARRFVDHGGELDASEKALMANFGHAVCKLWRKPDNGIWEIRLPPRHNTHSKLMCWVALDSLIALQRGVGLDIDEAHYVRERELIRADIETHGYDVGLNSFVGFYGGRHADASLLLLARYGFVAADDPRMIGTWRHIERELSDGGFLYRYPPGDVYDGIGGKEHLFAICNFWLVDYLARLGEVERATQLFERLVGLANDVGLFAEEFDRESHAPVGNFPQAFSHVGLITAALAIEQARQGRRGAEIAE